MQSVVFSFTVAGRILRFPLLRWMRGLGERRHLSPVKEDGRVWLVAGPQHPQGGSTMQRTPGKYQCIVLHSIEREGLRALLW
ncbi:hypothetical protein CEXT_389931 [Caerostris extrusa]|uniref:Uncharacterized protein n=1 Tax=Caerostris extrusa TaxID=172846 RepID=A0AAV4M6Z3_CAEEX|nr:hypothetical protein CEXT_389931 [Caerostris extrusa]